MEDGDGLGLGSGSRSGERWWVWIFREDEAGRFVGVQPHSRGGDEYAGIIGNCVRDATSARKQLDQVHSSGESSRLQIPPGASHSGPGQELEVMETEERRGPGTEPGALPCLEVREIRRSLQRGGSTKAALVSIGQERKV